jgi:two-component system phosphate regulon sensor histidine kinase PhoR
MSPRKPHSWRSHLKLVVFALVTVLIPAVIALTHLSVRQLDIHRYELEGALREQYVSHLDRIERQVQQRLERLEADILEAVNKGPEELKTVNAVRYWENVPHVAHVDLLDDRGEPLPLADALSIPAGDSCDVIDHWRRMATAGQLAFANGRLDESARFYAALGDSKGPDGKCPQARCAKSHCPSFIHLLGTLGQTRTALALADYTGTAARLEHLQKFHLNEQPFPIPDLPAVLEDWYRRACDPLTRNELSEKISAVVDGVKGRHNKLREAARDLSEFLGWRDGIEQARAGTVWHRSAAGLLRNDLEGRPGGEFIRRTLPDQTLLGVCRLSDEEGFLTFLTYRVAPAQWKSDIEQVLSELPSDTVVEISDGAGTLVAGTRVPAAGSLVQPKPLAAVPGWVMSMGPRDPSRLGAAVEKLSTAGFALIALVAVSVCVGLALLLVNYLRQARLAQMQSDFVSGVSHELKTPLALLQMSAETLWLGRYRSEQEGRDLQRRIIGQVEHLNRMVAGVLEFHRQERGQTEFTFGPVNLREIVADVLDAYRPQLDELGAKVELLPPLADPDGAGPRFPAVRADASALRQVLMNLLDNALKYCSGAPRVRVSAEVDGPRVRLMVSDSGIGMDEATRRRVFEKFFRGDSPEVQRHRGTGLGLAIVAHIVAGHGGDIVVESRPGVGSTFTVTLPVYEASAEPRPALLPVEAGART